MAQYKYFHLVMLLLISLLVPSCKSKKNIQDIKSEVKDVIDKVKDSYRDLHEDVEETLEDAEDFIEDLLEGDKFEDSSSKPKAPSTLDDELLDLIDEGE